MTNGASIIEGYTALRMRAAIEGTQLASRAVETRCACPTVMPLDTEEP